MQATVKYPQLAAVIAEIEKTGLSRASIGHLAGRDGSAATRWAKGTHQPTWSAAKSLADAIRAAHPGLADRLLAAWHYYNDPVEPAPGSTVPADVLAVIRKRYPAARQAEILGMLEQFSERDGATGAAGGQSPSRGDGGTTRAG